MDESVKNNLSEKLNIRYKGRLGQIPIFFGKQIRMFIYQSDWITIPMAVLIAGLVSLALGKNFGTTKEGTLMGIFALVCVSLWNGTFNSIQIICRERDVIKREHRSGMHISSYIIAHMLYQAIICLIQCTVTLITCHIVGMRFKGEGLFTPWLVVDIGISLFLATYAADMLALFISSVVRSTTIAMTVMPFVLIFQMVFSGGLFPLPGSISFITKVTISSPGFDSMASLMDVGNLQYKSINDMFNAINSTEMDVTFKGADIINMLSDENNDSVKQIREIEVGGNMTVEQVCNMILTDDKFSNLRSKPLIQRVTVGSLLDEIANSNEKKVTDLKAISVGGEASVREVIELILGDDRYSAFRNLEMTSGITYGQVFSGILVWASSDDDINNSLNTRVEADANVGDIINLMRTDERFGHLYDITLLDDTSIGEALRMMMNSNSFKGSIGEELSYYTNVGEVIDYLNNSDKGEEYKNLDIVYHVKFSDVLDRLGKDNLMKLIGSKTKPSMFTGDYTHSTENVLKNWIHLLILILISSMAAIIALEFIDKDKR